MGYGARACLSPRNRQGMAGLPLRPGKGKTLPGTLFLSGKQFRLCRCQQTTLTVDLERDADKLAAESQAGPERRRVCKGVQAEISSGNCRGNRKHAAISEAGDLVFENAGNHVGYFSNRVPYLFPHIRRINSQ